MIFECNQKERLPLTRHQFVNKGNVIGYAESPSPGLSNLCFGSNNFTIKFESFKKIAILVNNTEIGGIYPKLCVTKKILFIPIGYEYRELKFYNDTIIVYESGLGANQHYYSFYRNNEVIAVIHKPDRVINHLDNYVCYVDKDEDSVLVALYIMFLESNGEYYNIDATGNVDSNTATITAQKELVEKFDPSFIEKIIARDGNN